MQPFDLRTLASKHGFKTEYDESAELDRDQESQAWSCLIPGRDRRNFISVWSEDRLAAYTFTRRLHAAFKAIPGAVVVQEGGHELRISFAPRQLRTVARLLECRKARKLSPLQRERLIEAGRESRFVQRGSCDQTIAPCSS
jgi:hypothetical protein